MPLLARAQTFDMSYAGTDVSGATYGTTTGTGSFTLTSGTVSAFTLTIEQSAGPGMTDTFTWGLTDLEGGLSYTLTGDAITALSFTTDTQPGFYTPDTSFEVTDLETGDAFTFAGDVGTLTIGTLSVSPAPTSIPEPGALGVFGLGLLGLTAARRRLG
jgi:hypothetical protein